MSGNAPGSGPTRETVPSESWSVASLREYLEALLGEMDRRIEEKFRGVHASVEAAFLASEKAILKAEASSDKRFASVNEFRAALSDQSRQMITRPEYEALRQSSSDALAALAEKTQQHFEQVEGRLNSERSRSDMKQGGDTRSQAHMTTMFAVAAIVLSSIAILLRLFGV